MNCWKNEEPTTAIARGSYRRTTFTKGDISCYTTTARTSNNTRGTSSRCWILGQLRRKPNSKIRGPVVQSIDTQYRYAPVQESEARRLVVDLLSSNDFTKHLNRYSSSIVCTLAHGHRVESLDDSLLDEIYSAQNNTRKAFTLGIWAVDYLPSLNRLPKSLAPWKQTAEKWQHQEEAMRVKHLKTALQTRSWNWAKQLVANGKAIDRVEVAYDLGIMVDAGTEPSAAVLQVFVLAALLFPNFVAEGEFGKWREHDP